MKRTFDYLKGPSTQVLASVKLLAELVAAPLQPPFTIKVVSLSLVVWPSFLLVPS